jgi:hypothetical protein
MRNESALRFSENKNGIGMNGKSANKAAQLRSMAREEKVMLLVRL